MPERGVSHITLVHAGALGDTILLIPLLRSIRMRYAATKIALVTKPSFGKLLLSLGDIEAYADVDAPEHSRWFAPDADTIPSWSDADLLISAVSNGADVWFANARRVARYNSLRHFDPRPDEQFADHITVFHRRQLAALALPDSPFNSPVKNPQGSMVIHPGSGSARKNWPLERFLRLGGKLSDAGIPSQFLIGPVEEELFERNALQALRREFPVRSFDDLTLLVGYLRTARGFIGNDSGVTHLAAQLGIPTIALFGPSNPVQWRPIGPQVRVIQSRDGTMTGIAVDDILPQID